MAAEPKPVGVVGRRLAANLRVLRKGVSTNQLSALLSEIGWPIRANGITRVEMGSRHVDVDDLLALAKVLGVSPNRLMMPLEIGEQPGQVVGNVLAADSDMWSWATGFEPLVTLSYGPDGKTLLPGNRPSGPQLAEFMVTNQPQRYHRPTSWSAVSDDEATGRAMAEMFLDQFRQGRRPERIRDLLNAALDAAERYHKETTSGASS